MFANKKLIFCELSSQIFILTQGRDQGKKLGEAKLMGGHNLPPPPGCDRVNISENFG